MGLPALEALRRRLQALAALDAILCPDDWESRYHSFDARWAEGQAMGSRRDGEGNEYFAHFTPAGCFFKAFDHERGHEPDALVGVPPELASSVAEPAFDVAHTTFAAWRRRGDRRWRAKGDPGDLLDLVEGDPAAYARWAEGHFEVDVDRAAVAHVFALRPLTEDVVRRLNPEAALDPLAEDLEQIGYPK